jgi:hypothetical protein
MIYLVEMVLKIAALGFRGYVQQPVNTFDGIICVFSVVDLSIFYKNSHLK